MPLILHRIKRPEENSNDEYFSKPTKESVLQSITVARISGTLQQLSNLSDLAADIFLRSLKATDEIQGKISDISSRMNILVEYLPDVARTIAAEEFHMSAGATSQRSSEQIAKTNHISLQTMPPSLGQRYNHPLMRKTVPFHKIDELLSDDDIRKYGPCYRKYSDPDFFMNEWILAREKEERDLLELRASRRLEREQARAQKLLASSATQVPEKKKGINWRDRYAIDYTITQRPTKSARSVLEPRTDTDTGTGGNPRIEKKGEEVFLSERSGIRGWGAGGSAEGTAAEQEAARVSATSAAYQSRAMDGTTIIITTDDSDDVKVDKYINPVSAGGSVGRPPAMMSTSSLSKAQARFESEQEELRQMLEKQDKGEDGSEGVDFGNLSSSMMNVPRPGFTLPRRKAPQGQDGRPSEGESGEEGKSTGPRSAPVLSARLPPPPPPPPIGPDNDSQTRAARPSFLDGIKGGAAHLKPAMRGEGADGDDTSSTDSRPRFARSPDPAVESGNSSEVAPKPSSGRPSFLAEIGDGKANLKPGRRPPSGGSSSRGGSVGILAAIKQGQSLRPVVRTERPESSRKKSSIGIGAVYGDAVSSLLERRRQLQESDSEDDRNNDDWE